jgi:hypothetical protein
MQCCLIGLPPGLSGYTPGETSEDLHVENRSLTTLGRRLFWFLRFFRRDSKKPF